MRAAAVPKQDNVLFYQRVIGVGGIAIVAVLVFKIVAPFLAPIAWALFLGFLWFRPQGLMGKM